MLMLENRLLPVLTVTGFVKRLLQCALVIDLSVVVVVLLLQCALVIDMLVVLREFGLILLNVAHNNYLQISILFRLRGRWLYGVI